MTQEQAIKACAAWWADKYANGCKWDNGDAETESFQAISAGMVPRPVATVEQLQPIFERLCTEAGNSGLYCDYGNSIIDDALAAAGFPFKTMLHGPQKAGTRLRLLPDGSAEPIATGGYAKPWEELSEDGSVAKVTIGKSEHERLLVEADHLKYLHELGVSRWEKYAYERPRGKD